MIDILGNTKGTKLGIVFGANAIAVYVMGDVLALVFYGIPFGEKPLNSLAISALIKVGVLPNLASLIYALCFVAINFIPAYWLYKKKVFIKL